MTDGGSSEGRRREVISKREVTGWRPLTLAGATSRLGAPPPRAGRAGGTIRHRSRMEKAHCPHFMPHVPPEVSDVGMIMLSATSSVR